VRYQKTEDVKDCLGCEKPEDRRNLGKSLKVKQEAEKLKANVPYRQAQIGSEAVNVKRKPPIDKHR
jgi:hypothetical protein